MSKIRYIGGRAIRTRSRYRNWARGGVEPDHVTHAALSNGMSVDEVDAIHAANPRPRTRSECPEERPCPWVGCRYHLYLDISRSGALHLNTREAPWLLRDSCALDEAERGAMTLDEVAERLPMSREGVRRIEEQAFAKLKKALNSRRP